MSNLPLLHFLTDRSAFGSPTPLLLASVLYIAALHHPSSDQASLITGYFAATCCAISELVTPALYHTPVRSAPGWGREQHDSRQSKRENAFRNILGLIMASLSSEAYIDATGSWIAMAYRIWLDHCPVDLTTTTQDWRCLFSGLQVSIE